MKVLEREQSMMAASEKLGEIPPRLPAPMSRKHRVQPSRENDKKTLVRRQFSQRITTDDSRRAERHVGEKRVRSARTNPLVAHLIRARAARAGNPQGLHLY